MKKNIQSIFSSKTVWFNVLSLILVIIALPEFISVIPASYIPYIALLNPVVNYILRTYFTNAPLTAFAAKA